MAIKTLRFDESDERMLWEARKILSRVAKKDIQVIRHCLFLFLQSKKIDLSLKTEKRND